MERLGEDQNKLSTRFGEITDLVHEASCRTTHDGHKEEKASNVK
ncbi:MAG: Lon-insertion domain-containing protein [Chloroflexota bacterium]|nr:Lon-insertion domain-containing protein [Chloroflexota bacterium]